MMEQTLLDKEKKDSMTTVTGFVMFRCSQCGTSFLGPDKEENGTILYEPCTCPQCGHIAEKPFNFMELVRERREERKTN